MLNNNYFRARDLQSRKFGILDTTSHWVVFPQFDDISEKPAKNNYFAAEKSGAWGVIDLTGNWKIPPIYEAIITWPMAFRDVGIFFLCRKDNLWGAIDVLDKYSSWKVKNNFLRPRHCFEDLVALAYSESYALNEFFYLGDLFEEAYDNWLKEKNPYLTGSLEYYNWLKEKVDIDMENRNFMESTGDNILVEKFERDAAAVKRNYEIENSKYLKLKEEFEEYSKNLVESIKGPPEENDTPETDELDKKIESWENENQENNLAKIDGGELENDSIENLLNSPEYKWLREAIKRNYISKNAEKLKFLDEIVDEFRKNSIKRKTKGATEEDNWLAEMDSIVRELDSLIGLDAVKHEIHNLIDFIKIQLERKQHGFNTDDISYHLVFTGSPGTGKTTVAAIIAKIYKAANILSTGQVVNASRAELIASYLGQTAEKVNTVVDSALGGLLFIDEAYAICRLNDKNDSYGQEAVDTLILRIENDRNKFAIIMAGYKQEMEEFIDTNPGFKSRINRFIHFDDYSPEQLFEIFEKIIFGKDYNLSADAIEKIKEQIKLDYLNRDKSFGNGRYVRNLYEKIKVKQAARVSKMKTKTTEELITILGEDV